eukprot:gene21604-24499_t
MQKIVFNGHYLMYFDTAVTEYWRQLAMPYAQTMQQLGGDLFVKKASLEYHASAEMDDFLDVCMRCDRIGNSSMTFVGAIFRGEELLITSEMVYVYADPVAKKSQPIPAPLRDLLESFERAEDMVQLHLGSWHDFQKLASPLRTEVFVHEQKVPAELEWDHEDDTALHAVALNRMGLCLATGRLIQHAPGVARIGRMAVKKQMRGSDLGRRVAAQVRSGGSHGGLGRFRHAERVFVGGQLDDGRFVEAELARHFGNGFAGLVRGDGADVFRTEILGHSNSRVK